MAAKEPREITLMVLGMVLAVTAIGCDDKAKAPYSQCVQAEAAGDLPAAARSCETAVTVDPSTKSGKAAAEKLTGIKAQIAANEKARAMAAAAEQAKLDATCKWWLAKCKLADGVTPAKQAFKTKAECDHLVNNPGTFSGVRLTYCAPCECSER